MKKAYFQIILATFMWGTMGIFVRGLSALGISRMQISLLRVLTAAISMIPIVLWRYKRLPKVRLRDLWCFIGTGVISLTLYNLCYFTSMQHMTLSMAAVLTYTSPAFVILLSAVLFREKITQRRFWALILVFVGCAMVTGVMGGSAQHITFAGLLYGLGAGLSYALYSIFSRFALNRGYDTLTITFYTFLFSTIGCIPLADVGTVITYMTPMGWIYAISLGILCCSFPYMLYTKSLSAIDNGTASLLSTVETVVATVIGVFLYDEMLHWYNIVGIIVLFAGLCLPVYQIKQIGEKENGKIS